METKMNYFNDIINFTTNVLTIIISMTAIGIVVTIVILYIRDKTQSKHTILRNYPVIGRFRYYFEHLGEFFRQYFFSLDREELPFNRSERSWVYRAAKNIENTVAFGSTRRIDEDGTILFANSQFPISTDEQLPPPALTFGPTCDKPYTTNSLINISGMSFGAISKPAILALSRGAAKGGSWLNTGEGGITPYHLDGGCDIVFQIGTAKYGVRDLEGNLSIPKLKEVAAHESVRMFEIKLSQGAKPGKGGILPSAKITEEVAKTRNIKMGLDSVSPNRHKEIKSVGDLLDMIDFIRQNHWKARWD